MLKEQERQKILKRLFNSSDTEPLLRFLDVTPVGIVVVYRRQIIFVNRYVETVTGYRPEELLGRKTFPFFRDRKDWEIFGRNLYSALERGEKAVSFSWDFRKKDGEIFRAEVTTVPVEKINGAWLVLSTIRDITTEEEERLALEEKVKGFRRRLLLSHEKLLKERRFLIELIESLPVGLAVLKEGELLYRNALFEANLEGIPNLLDEIKRKIFEGEEEATFEREEKRFYARFTSLEGGYHLVLLQEVTYLWKLRERFQKFVELRTEERLANERLSFLGSMMAEVVHELNTPATFMRTNLHLLKAYLEGLERFLMEFSFAPEDENSLERIMKELREIFLSLEIGLERIIQLVRSVKSLGRLSEEPQEVDLGEVLSQALSLTYNRAKRYLEIVVNGEPFLFGRFRAPFRFLFRGRKGSLVQMLVILINNSVEAARERKIKKARLEITACEQQEGLWLSFADNCGGVPEEQLIRIFEPFYSTKKEGTGLGLYILKELAQSAGVKVSFINRSNPKGLEVKLFFPRRKDFLPKEDDIWPLKCSFSTTKEK